MIDEKQYNSVDTDEMEVHFSLHDRKLEECEEHSLIKTGHTHGRGWWSPIDDETDPNVIFDVNKKTIAIDFDGVIHSYLTPIGAGEQRIVLDPPVAYAKDAVLEYLEHFNVVFFTARHVSEGGIEGVKAWLKEWGFPNVPVTGKKPIAILYIDDRGYQFTGYNFPSIDYLKDFQPWNRKTTGNWIRE